MIKKLIELFESNFNPIYCNNECEVQHGCDECPFDSRKKFDNLLGELREAVSVCKWKKAGFDDDRVAIWDTGCGKTHKYIDNDFTFCPYCKGIIEEVSK